MPSLHELLSALTASLQALYTTALVMLFCAAAYAVVGMELFKVPGGSQSADVHCGDPIALKRSIPTTVTVVVHCRGEQSLRDTPSRRAMRVKETPKQPLRNKTPF